MESILCFIVIIGLSVLYWSFNYTYTNNEIISFTLSTYDFNDWLNNQTNWSNSISRTLMDFLPVVSLEQKTTHLIDYLVKVLSGVIVFGLAAIALRRKFERRYRH